MLKARDVLRLMATIIYHKNYCGIGVNEEKDFNHKKNIYEWLQQKEININLLINRDYVATLAAEWEVLEKQATEACK